MKRWVATFLALVFASATMLPAVSAAPRHRDDRHDRQRQEYQRRPERRPHHSWSNSSFRHPNWRRNVHRDPLPFRWYEKRSRFAGHGYRMVPIHDYAWNNRFPGLRAYRWYDRADRGFWYRGHRITNAVMFYDNSDELVSVGFMHNGAFIFLRDDDNAFENRDSFFMAWWR